MVDRQANPPPAVPTGPEALTPEWLTRALRSSGTISRASVTSAEVRPLGEGRGFAGRLARVGLAYDVQEAGAPASLVAKFPTANSAVRATLTRLGLYERELRFYRELAPHAGVRTPLLYFGALDPAGTGAGDSVLLLEEVAPSQTGDNLAGCAPHEACACRAPPGAAARALVEQPGPGSCHLAPGGG